MPSDPEEITDEMLPEIIFPERTQRIMRQDGSTIKIALKEPRPLAPAFHDTPEENQIDDELSLATTAISNMNRLWKAVSTVKEGIDLAEKTCKVLEHRRRLSNKQLGAKESNSRGTIWHIPDKD